MMENAADLYREEAGELIAGLEISLLELEKRPDDREAVDTVFRALHTIKGSGAMFGFDRISEFTHRIESAFDLVRNGELRISRDLINITLAARDHIKELLEGGEPSGTEVLEGLARLLGDNPGGPASADPPLDRIGHGQAADETWRIRYTPAPDCLLNGTNPLLLLGELREMGKCEVLAATTRIPDLRAIDPELCYLGWDAILTTARPAQEVRDVFLFAGEDEVRIEAAGQPEQNAAPKEFSAAQEHLPERRENQDTADSMASIRVSADKLDLLANIVGELVTVQARLTQLAGASGDPEINFVAEEVERLTSKLRDNTTSIRMLPIGTAFNRFRRLVRDLSRDLGKEVELVAEGAETELDKTVIERLHDPLVHIIRNSMDHGIELPAARAAAGKPRQGRICLSAEHAGASVLIRVADDGAGLDTAAIRERAIERGLIAPGAEMTEDQIHGLILKAGFSTAREVTGISGRGVGMDVVQRAIASLRGSLEIAGTQGQGTTITLRLPLTLAIIDGLLVEVGGAFFVLPLSSILECIEMGPAERRLHGGHMVVVRHEPVGCIRLREIFSVAGAAPVLEQVVIAETPQGKFGFVVDRVVGDHQTVIKPLSGFYRHVQFISGATILGDGNVALIIDADKLAELALAGRNGSGSHPQFVAEVPQPGNDPVAQLGYLT